MVPRDRHAWLIARQPLPRLPRFSLDALCRRFGVDNSSPRPCTARFSTVKYLAEVYLELIGGRQPRPRSRRSCDCRYARPTRPHPPHRAAPPVAAPSDGRRTRGPRPALWQAWAPRRCGSRTPDQLSSFGACCAASRRARSCRYSARKSINSRFRGGNPPSRVTSLTIRRT